MSYNNISSLTPSRPAPTPPSRSQSSRYTEQHASATAHSTERGTSGFSSTAYTSSFPILNASSALGPAPTVRRNEVVRTGLANMKEEGLRSFLWSKRWLVLDASELAIFKSEVSW